MNTSRATTPLAVERQVVTIALPPAYAVELDRLTEAFAGRTGEPLEDVRRAVETTVLRRGIEALKREWEVR